MEMEMEISKCIPSIQIKKGTIANFDKRANVGVGSAGHVAKDIIFIHRHFVRFLRLF